MRNGQLAASIIAEFCVFVNTYIRNNYLTLKPAHGIISWNIPPAPLCWLGFALYMGLTGFESRRRES